MKMPSWIIPDIDQKAEVFTDAEGKMWTTFTFKVRRWHPGFWLAVVKAKWSQR